MRQLIGSCLFMLIGLTAWAQSDLSGVVLDQETKAPLVGATVVIGNDYGVYTDGEGKFLLKNLKAPEYLLRVTYVGYEALEQRINPSDFDSELQIDLKPSSVLADEVIVSATRADMQTPTTFTDLNEEELGERNLGQDMPYLLKMTPSLVVTSDAGAGIGYTGLRIRGSDASRINTTINGIPYNDSESQGVFWVDLPDFASSAKNVQIQRGVGTSTNGAGAFGATVNVQTFGLEEEAYGEVSNSYGSFNTWKNTVQFGTGLIKDHWTFDGRLSNITSDGYIDRASADLKAYYVSGGYYGKNTIIRATTFSGKEITYQAWNGVPEYELEENRTMNIAGTDWFSKEEPYDREVDNYLQNHYQLHLSQKLNDQLHLNAAFNYTLGRGYYELYKVDADFGKYGLEPIATDSTEITSTDLIERRWLDNDFYVGTFGLDYAPSSKLNLTLGGAYAVYDGDHFGEVIWARYASNSEIRDRYYDNNGLKNDFNIFAKANYQVSPRLNLFGDIQYRTVSYEFLGFDNDGSNVTQDVELSFINPKAGLTYQLNANTDVYASFAIANKEPSRSDYTESSPSSRPEHETLYDTEVGYRHQAQRFSLMANVYYMSYKNQLVLNGQINDVGEYTRVNVPDSYRAGIELAGGIKLLDQLTWDANLTISQNKIKELTEYIDDYDNDSTYLQLTNTFNDTDLAFSPNLIIGSTLTYMPTNDLELSLLTKYVGKQFLDNTANDNRALDAYLVNDIRLAYTIRPKFMNAIGLNILLNNVLSEVYESNGYTFSYKYGGDVVTENYYYPQAKFNWLAGLTIKF